MATPLSISVMLTIEANAATATSASNKDIILLSNPPWPTWPMDDGDEPCGVDF